MGKKKKQKKKPINWQELAISAVIDLIIGTILILDYSRISRESG